MYEENGRNNLEKYKQTGVEDEEGLQAIIGASTFSPLSLITLTAQLAKLYMNS